MATKVFTVEEIELQDGTVVEIKPLNIKRLRKFMEIVAKFEGIENESDSVDLMVEACKIALAKSAPQLVDDPEALEEALDIPTMWKILEVAGGVKQPDPNLLAAVEQGGRI